MGGGGGGGGGQRTGGGGGGGGGGGLPKKRLYRARAHSNPLSDAQFSVPLTPAACDWSKHYPAFIPKRAKVESDDGGNDGDISQATPCGSDRDGDGADIGGPLVRFADVGCGFGGLLVRLSPIYPDTLMVGMELRDKVCEYVRERITALRAANINSKGYTNVSVIRTNAMKYLPNYFRKGQLTKMFFLFPDPHFKTHNHRRRIISRELLAEYAYFLAPGGWLYTITDVEELGVWMRERLEAHPLFERVSDEEIENDRAAQLLTDGTEEGQKVARNQGQTFRAIFRRIQLR
eukprot:jgi/Chlat1/7356/Chrsp59S06977